MVSGRLKNVQTALLLLPNQVAEIPSLGTKPVGARNEAGQAVLVALETSGLEFRQYVR